MTMRFNPFTGRARDAEDIATDPHGKLLADPFAPYEPPGAPPQELRPVLPNPKDVFTAHRLMQVATEWRQHENGEYTSHTDRRVYGACMAVLTAYIDRVGNPPNPASELSIALDKAANNILTGTASLMDARACIEASHALNGGGA